MSEIAANILGGTLGIVLGLYLIRSGWLAAYNRAISRAVRRLLKLRDHHDAA